MKSRIYARKKSTREQTPDFSTAPAQPMFQSRSFVVQTQKAETTQKPDLKTGLKRAERYGHNLGRMHPPGVSAEKVVQRMKEKPNEEAIGESKTSSEPSKSEEGRIESQSQTGLKVGRKKIDMENDLQSIESLVQEPVVNNKIMRDILQSWEEKNIEFESETEFKDGLTKEYKEKRNEATKGMEDLKEKEKMRWNGAKAKEYETWLKENNKEKEKEPTEANCWNAVLLGAYRAGLITKDYIKQANQAGDYATEGPLLARTIAKTPRDSVIKDKQVTDQHARQKKYMEELTEKAKSIPRGDVVVLGSNGSHVCLSLGGGGVLELDKMRQGTKTVNPNYDSTWTPQRRKIMAQINLKTSRAKRAKPEDQVHEELKTLQTLYMEKEKNKADQAELTQERPSNEMLELNLIEMRYHEITWLDTIEGVYWGPLPHL